MKFRPVSFPFLSAAILLACDPQARSAVPEVGAAVAQEFGDAQFRNIVLIKADPSAGDPAAWKVFSRDPYRAGQQVRAVVSLKGGKWAAEAAGAGKLLQRSPKTTLDFTKIRIDSAQARSAAAQAAASVKKPFASVEYQLAAGEQTGSPEWGLALISAAGEEAGFVVVSAESGLVLSQEWAAPASAGKPGQGTNPPPEQQGAAAAKRVKTGLRKAWNWTEDAGKKTGGFFRELFR